MFKSLPYHYKIATIYILILFLDRIDLTVLNVAIPTITKVFGMQIELAEWFSIAFLIGLSIAMSVSSWLGESFGYKKMFIWSTICFALFSLGCSIAPNFEIFVLSRFLQGFFGGMIITTGNAILYMCCDKKDYAKITDFVFTITLLAPAIAPVIGGIMIKYFSYKWIFYMNIPICFMVVILSIIVIKDVNKFEKLSFDFKGLLVSSILYITFFIGASFISQNKIYYASILLILSSVLAYIFVKIESKSSNPIFNFLYLKRKLFRQAVLIQLFFQMSHFGSFFIIGLFLQIGLGFEAWQAGLIISMQAVGAILIKLPPFKYTYSKIGIKKKLLVGLTGVATITPLILLISSKQQLYFASLIMLFRGLMSGYIGSTLATMGAYEAQNKVEVGRMGSMFIIARQLSISFGICFSALSIGISNFFCKYDYLNKILTYNEAIHLFGLGIAVISLFCIISSWIACSVEKIN